MRFRDVAYSEIYGKGISTPIKFVFGSNNLSKIGVVDGIEKVHQAIFNILSTRKKSRPMRPEHGSNLPLLVFDPGDVVTQDQIVLNVQESIERARPIIKVTYVNFVDLEHSGDEGWIGIDVGFHILGTQITGNYVYPYYLRTGGSI